MSSTKSLSVIKTAMRLIAISVVALTSTNALATTDYVGVVLEAYEKVCAQRVSFEERKTKATEIGLVRADDAVQSLFERKEQFTPDKSANLTYEFQEGGAFWLGILEGKARSFFRERRSGSCFVMVLQEEHDEIRKRFKKLIGTPPSKTNDRDGFSSNVWGSSLSEIWKMEIVGFNSRKLENGFWWVTLYNYKGELPDA